MHPWKLVKLMDTRLILSHIRCNKQRGVALALKMQCNTPTFMLLNLAELRFEPF